MSDGWDGWDEPGGRSSGGYRRPRRRGVRADDAYGYGGQDGYGADGYGGQDGYADDGYGGGDPYAPADGGYAAADGYGAYGAQDGYGQYAGYESGGGYDGQDDGYGWRESGPAQIPAVEGSIDADSPRHNSFFRGFGGGGDAYLVRTSRPRVRTVKRKKSSGAGLVALAVVAIMFGGVGVVGYHYYHLYKARHAVYTGTGTGSTTILVNKGDSFSSIGPQLVRKHVIAAVDPWASYISTKPGSLQPGAYRIHIHMSPAAAYAALIDLKNLVKVTIPDGLPLVKLLPKMASESG
ncbi:MAG: endolytic transglycosylase MltG, partial [Actinobacteria bacterium]|nr:endolytic transglycosylase MltG [Actinomycetota bacterium]